MISEYCQVCLKFGSCTNSKTCSCTEFETDVNLKVTHKKLYAL